MFKTSHIHIYYQHVFYSWIIRWIPGIYGGSGTLRATWKHPLHTLFCTYLHNTSQTPWGGAYPLTLDTSDLICSIQLLITDLDIEPSLSSICHWCIPVNLLTTAMSVVSNLLVLYGQSKFTFMLIKIHGGNYSLNIKLKVPWWSRWSPLLWNVPSPIMRHCEIGWEGCTSASWNAG